MTTQCVVRAALTEERSKAEIPLGFAVSRRDQVLLPKSQLPPKAAVGQCFPICEANGDFSRRGKLAAERSEAASPSAEEPTATEGGCGATFSDLRSKRRL